MIMKTEKLEIEVTFTAKQLAIFEKIFSFSWGTNARALQKTLFELALEFIRSELIDGAVQKFRDEIAFHLLILRDLIEDLAYIEVNIKTLNHKQREFYELILNTGYWEEISNTSNNIKITLSELTLIYIRSERAPDEDQETRERTASHLQLLRNLVDDVKECALAGE